ncbi:MAG: hypothetical protein MI724_19375 [Spirochaetales bacterium]|nr:hypothetical protein [Spirochaetales bacterium]
MQINWGEFDIADGGEVSCSVGDLHLRIVLSNRTYRIHVDGGPARSAGVVGWHDAHIPAAGRVRIEPATPDLPVVLRPSIPIALSCGEAVHYRILLPLWIRVAVDDAAPGCRREILFDLPSRTLKRTWFGAAEGGEIAYVGAFDPQSREAYQRHQCVVPVTIRNGSDSVLWFERFLLRVIHLDLYRMGPCVESNGVTVAFKGREQLSQISFEAAKTTIERGGVPLTTSRIPAGSDIIRKSFLWLKSLAG